jgi:hypothetical protein
VSVAELAKVIGQTGALSVEGLLIPVKVRDVRTHWGRVDYWVEPVGGDGLKWVSADRVRLPKVEESDPFGY